MSKVSYEPNNTKNGHLGAKLEPIENRKFPKNRFHTPTTKAAIDFRAVMPKITLEISVQGWDRNPAGTHAQSRDEVCSLLRGISRFMTHKAVRTDQYHAWTWRIMRVGSK